MLSNRRVAAPSLLRQENVALRRLVDLPGTRSPPQSHHTANARTPAPATTSSNGGTYHYRRPGLGSSPGSTVGESHSLASSAMGSGRVQVPSPAGAAYLDASLRALRSSQTGTLPLSFPPPAPVSCPHLVMTRHTTWPHPPAPAVPSPPLPPSASIGSPAGSPSSSPGRVHFSAATTAAPPPPPLATAVAVSTPGAYAAAPHMQAPARKASPNPAPRSALRGGKGHGHT